MELDTIIFMKYTESLKECVDEAKKFVDIICYGKNCELDVDVNEENNMLHRYTINIRDGEEEHYIDVDAIKTPEGIACIITPGQELLMENPHLILHARKNNFIDAVIP